MNRMVSTRLLHIVIGMTACHTCLVPVLGQQSQVAISSLRKEADVLSARLKWNSAVGSVGKGDFSLFADQKLREPAANTEEAAYRQSLGWLFSENLSESDRISLFQTENGSKFAIIDFAVPERRRLRGTNSFEFGTSGLSVPSYESLVQMYAGAKVDGILLTVRPRSEVFDSWKNVELELRVENTTMRRCLLRELSIPPCSDEVTILPQIGDPNYASVEKVLWQRAGEESIAPSANCTPVIRRVHEILPGQSFGMDLRLSNVVNEAGGLHGRFGMIVALDVAPLEVSKTDETFCAPRFLVSQPFVLRIGTK